MSEKLEYYLRKLKQLPRVRKTRSKRRINKSWSWRSSEVNNEIMNNEKIFIGASDFSDYIFSQLMDSRFKNNISTFNREYQFHCSRKKWHNFMEEKFDDEYIIESGNSSGIVITENFNFFKYDLNSNSATVNVYGDTEFVEYIKTLIFSAFEEVTSYIEWVYSSEGNSVNVPLNKDRLPVLEMYPFLKNESLEEYYNRFLNSSANILLLIGPPGTGKTTFIRGLLSHSNSSAIVTYDSSILEKDYLFARFIEDESTIMVLEDSDNFLKARSDGNSMMHRFLNVGDGLVTTKGKKLIFSTNLPSIRDIDSALVRPGRCFDILKFETLTQSQAEKLAKRVNVELEDNQDRWTIAEIFNKKSEASFMKKIDNKIGFL